MLLTTELLLCLLRGHAYISAAVAILIGFFALDIPTYYLLAALASAIVQGFIYYHRAQRTKIIGALSTDQFYHQSGHIEPQLLQQIQQTLFSCCGFLCKRTGAVLKSDILATEQLMSLLNYQSKLRKQCIAYFNTGKHPQFTPASLLTQHHVEQPQQAIFICYFGFCVNRYWQLYPTTMSRYDRICRRLIIYRFGLQLGINSHCWRTAQTGNKHQRLTPKLLKAYKQLELSPGASGREITLQYRRLLNRYHPDKQQTDLNTQQKLHSIKQAYVLLSAKKS